MLQMGKVHNEVTLPTKLLSLVQLFVIPVDSPGSSGTLQAKDTGLGSHALLQGIFLTHR